MKKSIKVIRTIATMGIGIMLVCVYLLGTTHVETITEVQTITETKEVIPDSYIDTDSKAFKENYIDMRVVIDYTATERDCNCTLRMAQDTISSDRRGVKIC